MHSAATVDVRTIPGANRHSEILRAFDGLAPGARMLVVSNHHPKPLLLRFSLDRPGAFEWNTLELGPTVHRVEIVKRARGGTRTVSEYLETDHRRLDVLVARTSDRVSRQDFAAARRAFDEFACGLERHMLAEEQVLFPVFERTTGMTVGPISVMTREHALLRELVAAARDALFREDAEAVRDALSSAAQVLELHNMKEERVIYPHTDRALNSDAERDALVLGMQGV